MDKAFLAEIAERKLPALFAEILWRRGIRDESALAAFFNEDLANLHDPYLMYDMEKAVARIQKAVLEGERILVYGDYDADGITSTTIMKETLELLGADVVAFLPNRFLQGYGPNLAKYQEIVAEGIQLIITVDNGVAGHEAIAFAQSQGVDVVVTDHHELPQELPEAYAVVHPRHPQGTYPFGDLAGVGVAFKVATALLEEPPAEFLDLVAIGTVADLVSLTGENRILIKAGLEAIKQTERIGLLALCEKSGVALNEITETSIGFSIGPRLNAIGRLGDANPAVDLMSTFDEEEAQELATLLEEKNVERKGIVETITQEALSMINPQNNIHLLAKENWHEGVLGIVAGNVMQQTGKPAILLALKEDGTAKGSGRSVEQLNLFEMLTTVKELFTHFGGHHAAVGLTMPAENIPVLQEKMNQYILENEIDLSAGAPLVIDGILQPEEATVAFVQSLSALAPFGTDNPLPTFLLENIQPQNVKLLGATQQHLKFSVDDKETLEAIAFNFGKQASEFSGTVDIVGQLSINEWNGLKKAQMQLKDFQVKGIQFFDWRGKRNWQQALAAEETLFVAFQKVSSKILPANLQAEVVVFDNLAEIQQLCQAKQYQQLAVLDVPSDLTLVQQIVQQGEFSRVYLYGYSEEEAYLNGLGSREQYGKLFSFIKNQQQVDVRYKLDQLAQFLKIPKNLLIFMIKVFSELKFVTIEDGVLRQSEEIVNRPLTESQLYQQRMRQIENEEFLLLADSEKIKAWLQG
ncbi:MULTISPECIES: single-stranded-DNA-specific exonuclease RecJ [unclassified Enterococcus]|uniref:single-stranded-DNA-specific exonuclease RecJ n=1 Tax=unclassified Enterococcus TaxID=2608891 RepID=UPI0024772B10|nr:MULTISPECIES: single-stranded-DNA-specific exonuclease RecJ [unclassified Enterococcus]